MFLKSLEIKGFKSFADRTVISFKKGITAVVGPNGSGKSNISDAVRWVLGEQSIKSLRGSRMEDVIFSGSEVRKPIGMAEVSLILENEKKELPIDYSEVKVTRKLYRSGESEYYINGSICRLKDIQELFMDTGIGKEGYSIIGQGKIDAILSEKPDDRRLIFEEAAGIVKFKTRKEEAEKKLSSTQENLTRIGDILSTYKERLEPLRNESEKAKKFIKLSGLLKEKEINIILDSISKNESKLRGFKDSLNKLNDKIAEIGENKNALQKSIEEKDSALSIKKNEYEENKEKYYANKEKLQKLNSEIYVINEKINNFKDVIKKDQNEVSALNYKLNSINESNCVIQKDFNDLSKKKEYVDSKISEYESLVSKLSYDVKENSDKVSSYKDNKFDVLSEITKLRNNDAIIKNNIDSCVKKIDQIKSSIVVYKNNFSENEKSILKFNDALNECENKINSHKTNINIKNNKLRESSIECRRLEKELESYNIKFNEIHARENILKNYEEHYEGYNRASRTLMNEVKRGSLSSFSKKCIIVGDIIKTDKNFETAIDISLGGSISNIVTQDEVIAKKLISYLKTNKAGRTTFLPMNIIRPRKIVLDENIRKIDGFVGIADELTEYDGIYKNIVQYLLGRTIVSSDMDSALEIANSLRYRFKVVTLKGDIVNPGGALTGGSFSSKSSGIIGRKNEIEKLEKELLLYKNKVDSLKKSISSGKEEINSLNAEIGRLKDDIYSESINKTKILEKSESIKKENKKINNDANTMQNEISMLEGSRSSLEHEKKENISKIDELSKNEELYTKSIAENEKKYNESLSEYNLKNENLTKLKINKARIDEAFESKKKELNRSTDDSSELKEKMNSLNKEIIHNNDLLKKCSFMLQNNNNEVKKVKECIEKYDKSIKEADIDVTKIGEDINALNSKAGYFNDFYSKKKDEKHRIEVQKAKYETEKEVLYNRLNVDMELTYTEALDYKYDDIDIDKIKRESQSLKKEINDMGNVNVSAVEEYKDLSEKYSFLNEQKDDLVNSKNELEKVIDEMMYKMKNIFNTNFKILKNNFKETFRELFKGGNADLLLEGDELESNIEIRVEPPGKKLQNINLLSGGEKVLSAIALLFSILKMKPTPFCILDEIEASLDDVNVARFADFVEKFSNKIQFILITHRKGTMQACNMLYGVTMQEKGVSKVVSLDLEDAEELE